MRRRPPQNRNDDVCLEFLQFANPIFDNLSKPFHFFWGVAGASEGVSNLFVR